MFLVSRRLKDGTYEIWDSRDERKEVLDAETLRGILDDGYMIFGLDKYGYDSVKPVDVFLLLISPDNQVTLFDGWTLLRYSSVDMTGCQLLDFRGFPDVFSSERKFYTVIQCLQDTQGSPTGLANLESYPVGYDAIQCKDSGVIALRDYDDEYIREYNFPYSACMNILRFEKKQIRGLSITAQSVRVGSTAFTIVGDLKKCFRLDKFNSLSNGSKLEKALNVTWESLEPTFEGKDVIVLEDFRPCVNFTKHITSCSFRYQQEPHFWEQFGDVIDIDNGVVTYHTGYQTRDWKDIYHYRGLIMNWGSKEIADEFDVEGRKFSTKARALGHEDYVYNRDCFSCDTSAMYGRRIRLVKSKNPALTVRYFRTEVGSFEIVPSYREEMNIWGCRYSGLQSSWYDMPNGMVRFGTMKAGGQDKNYMLCNEEFLEWVDKAENEGIIYMGGNVIPLCIRAFKLGMHCIELEVVCMMCGDKGWDCRTGYQFFTMPLILCGGTFIEYSDCLVYSMLFEDLVMEKSLVTYLFGYVKSGDYTYKGGMESLYVDECFKKNGRAMLDLEFKSRVKMFGG